MDEAQEILTAATKRLLEWGETLERDRARALLHAMLEAVHGADAATLAREQVRIAALLGALAARGETVEELAGFVDALRGRVTPIPLTAFERTQLVDTCGTGGDLSGTFNISTAAGLVAAAAGARVAKHGNRAVTSKCGSADVLEALGIPVDLAPEEAARALRKHGFAFLAAPSLQPAMKAMMPVRRAIGVRTVFNILGPMTNPAGAEAQVMGVYSERLVAIAGETLARLNTRHAFVVHGFDAVSGTGMDEFSISGSSSVAEVRGKTFRLLTLTPADFGLDVAPIASLAGGDAAANAEILHAIFAGRRGPHRDVVVMNAAAVLVAAGLAANFLDGARLAQDTMDAGKVSQLVRSLAGG